jgi:glucose/arabinose dehydrogenase
MNMKYAYFLLPLLLLLSTVRSHAEELDHDIPYQTTVIARGLGIPWGMTFLSDDTLLISQREAILSLLNLTTNTLTTINGLPEIKVNGQGGLFDVARSPDYANTGWIYLSYAKEIAGKSATTLARAKLVDNTLTDWQDLLITQSRTDKNVHFGGRITFDHDGHVFMSVGDRGVRTNAQDLTNHAGKIVRVNLDGSIPKDNFFVNDAAALNEIWSYGHRNPQGLHYHLASNTLWAIEHGPRGGDEINLIQAGNNYGWPTISYGMEYWGPFPVGKGESLEGMEQPIKYYIPSIAPSSLILYSGKAFPQWSGNLFSGALALQHLNRVVLNKQNQAVEEERLLPSIGRVRNIIEDKKGYLYLATDNGQLIQIKPKNRQ